MIGGGDLVIARPVAHRFDGGQRAKVCRSRGLAGVIHLKRRFHLPQIVDQPRGIDPLGSGVAGLDQLGMARRKEQAALLDADAPALQAQIGHRLEHMVRKLFMVIVPVEPRVAHLVLHGDAFHRPAGQRHLAIAVEHQHMRGKEAPMVEPGEPVDAFGHRDEDTIEPRLGESFAGPTDARAKLGVGEGGGGARNELIGSHGLSPLQVWKGRTLHLGAPLRQKFPHEKAKFGLRTV